MIRLLLWPGLPYLLAAVVVSVVAFVGRHRDPEWDATARHEQTRTALERTCERARRGA